MHHVSLGFNSQPGSLCGSVPSPVSDTEPDPLSDIEPGQIFDVDDVNDGQTKNLLTM